MYPFDDDLESFYAGPQAQAQSPGARPAPKFPPLDPQDEDSILSHLLGKAVSGLGYVGQSLDKAFGGRAIRGVLGGKPEELASLIPFSDTLGLTDQQNAVSGRDLLTKAGILDAPTPGFDLGDVAGFGADVLLDPASYLTFGASALTAAGREAKAAGTLGKTLGERLAASPVQGGLVGLRVPFTESGVALGTGPTAQKIGAKLSDLYEKAAYSAPGRALSGVFDPAVREAFTEPLQRGSRKATEQIGAETPKLREMIAGRLQDLQQSGELGPETSDRITQALEGYSGPNLPQTQQAIGQLRDYLSTLNPEESGLGILTSQRENYAPRFKTPLEQNAGGLLGRGRALDPYHASLQAREEILQGLPKGVVNQLAKDPELSGVAHGMTAEQFDQAKPSLAALVRDRYLTPLGITENPLEQSTRLADFAGKLPKDYAEKGLDFFGNSIFSDVLTRGQRSIQSVAKAGSLHDVLAKAAVPAGEAAGDAVPLLDALKAGISPQGQVDATGLASAQMRRLVGLGKLAPGQEEAMLNLRIPKDLAADVSRSVQGFTQPESLKPLIGAFDSVTNLTKTLQTVPWPARYARNLMQQMWGMFVGGHSDPRFNSMDPRAWLQPMADAKAAFRDNGVVEGAAQMPFFRNSGMTDEQATKALQRLNFAHEVTGTGGLRGDVDVVGAGAEHAAQKDIQVPGTAQDTLAEVLGTAIPKSLAQANPLNLRGVGGRTATQFSLAKAGGKADELIDDLTRGGSFISLMRQGFTPEAAAREVQKVHYDYGNLTAAEKAVGRRAVPFYSWLKQNIPAQLQQVLEQPGGKTAAAIRGSQELGQKEPGGFVPDFIADKLSVPLGESTPGTERFLTGLGLPQEDFSLLETGHGLTGNVGGTLSNALAELNPLIKLPIELATGKQLSTQRDLRDLAEPFGGALPKNVVLDEALMNSPLGRLATTYHTLTDPRKSLAAKAVNLVSPARIYDLDIEKARQRAERDLVDEMLGQSPNIREFSRPYVSPEDAAKLSPQENVLMRLQAGMEREAQQRAKQKRIGLQQPTR